MPALPGPTPQAELLVKAVRLAQLQTGSPNLAPLRAPNAYWANTAPTLKQPALHVSMVPLVLKVRHRAVTVVTAMLESTVS